ncbi:ABC transporter ATP-binding protein [Candidatus Hydrogenedentota bacterium]
MDYCIETFELSKNFSGFQAVDCLKLKVEYGSFYGFLGPNGAGKSTTIKMLTGLMAPNRGSARLLGHDLGRESLEIKSKIGVVPEELCLFENLTGREYLTFIGKMYRMKKRILAERTDELLAVMNLDENEKTLVLEFSHGMKKKLTLAAALIHDPELLFLDEPFEGIDAIASRAIRGILEKYIQRERTVFLTSHILEIVEKLCTHVGIIHKGRLVKEGSLDELSRGSSLEELFINAVGEPEETEASLSWLAGVD